MKPEDTTNPERETQSGSKKYQSAKIVWILELYIKHLFSFPRWTWTLSHSVNSFLPACVYDCWLQTTDLLFTCYKKKWPCSFLQNKNSVRAQPVSCKHKPVEGWGWQYQMVYFVRNVWEERSPESHRSSIFTAETERWHCSRQKKSKLVFFQLDSGRRESRLCALTSLSHMDFSKCLENQVRTNTAQSCPFTTGGGRCETWLKIRAFNVKFNWSGHLHSHIQLLWVMCRKVQDCVTATRVRYKVNCRQGPEWGHLARELQAQDRTTAFFPIFALYLQILWFAIYGEIQIS